MVRSVENKTDRGTKEKMRIKEQKVIREKSLHLVTIGCTSHFTTDGRAIPSVNGGFTLRNLMFDNNLCIHPYCQQHE
jgi:hypothetical protein